MKSLAVWTVHELVFLVDEHRHVVATMACGHDFTTEDAKASAAEIARRFNEFRSPTEGRSS